MEGAPRLSQPQQGLRLYPIRNRGVPEADQTFDAEDPDHYAHCRKLPASSLGRGSPHDHCYRWVCLPRVGTEGDPHGICSEFQHLSVPLPQR